MNKYHNRNRIFSPIMTIHDILTLHILSSFLSSLSFLSSFLSSFLPFSPSLFSPSLFSISLPFFPPFLFSISLPFFPPLYSLSSLSFFPFLSLLSSLFPFFFIFPLSLSPSPFSLSSIVKGEDYLTIQTSSVIVPGCPNDGEQTYMALFSHAYLLSAGASKRGAALK